MNFIVPAEHWLKLKESESLERSKNVEHERQQEKLNNQRRMKKRWIKEEWKTGESEKNEKLVNQRIIISGECKENEKL